MCPIKQYVYEQAYNNLMRPEGGRSKCDNRKLSRFRGTCAHLQHVLIENANAKMKQWKRNPTGPSWLARLQFNSLIPRNCLRPYAVPMETTTFLGAVLGLAALMLVLFLYISRKWCFHHKHAGFPCCDENNTLPSKYIHKMGKCVRACVFQVCVWWCTCWRPRTDDCCTVDRWKVLNVLIIC